MSSGNLPPQNTGDQMERVLAGAMNDFASRRVPRTFDGRAMIRKARRRTWTIGAAAAALVLAVSGGTFAVTQVVRGSDHPNVPIGTTQSPSPSTSPGSTSPSQSAPGQPLSSAEVGTAVATVAAIYGDFEVFNLDGHKSDTATRFASHNAYTAVWGSGKAPGAPMACSARFAGSVVGDPVLTGPNVTVPVQLYSGATAASKQAVVTLTRSSMKVSGVTCQARTALPGSAGERAARTALVSYYGPYLAGTGGSPTKWLTSTFRAGPDGHDTMDQFNTQTCSQDDPTAWVVGRIRTSGSTATAALRLYANTVTATVDVNKAQIAFVDCVPLPAVPHPAGTATVATAQSYLSQFFGAYEVAWGWRSIHPVKPMLADYFAAGALNQAWTNTNGLGPQGCTTSAPYVDAYLVEGSGHKSGSTAKFGLTLFDAGANEVGTGTLTIDLKTLKITDVGC